MVKFQNVLLLPFCFLLVIAFAGFAGCAKKPVVKPQSPPVVEPEPVVEPIADGTPSAPSDEPAEEPSLRGKEFKETENLKKIYFDYDDDKLNVEARSVLSDNSLWLKKNQDVEVLIEGHCDERGTVEYNMALGDRRAKAVRRYLMKLGVSGKRIATISYGEEKPVDFGHDENAWAKNRRAETLGRILPIKKVKN